MVHGRLAAVGFPENRTRIHKGFVTESTFVGNDRLPKAVSFAYVDFDFYEPIRVTLDFLDGVMPVGGIIIVDDYDFFSTGVKKAVEEFTARHPGRYHTEIPDARLGHFAVLTRKA